MRLIDADDVDNHIVGSVNLSGCPTINAISIPEDATNGDVIRAMFPSINFTEMTFTVHATTSVTSNGVKGGISYDFWKDWWNAKYKGVDK